METASLWWVLTVFPSAWLLGQLAKRAPVTIFRVVCVSCGEALSWRLFRRAAALDALLRGWHVRAESASCPRCDAAAAPGQWEREREARRKRASTPPVPLGDWTCAKCGELLSPWESGPTCEGGCMAPGGGGGRRAVH